MNQFFEKVSSQQDPFKKLMSYVPGFGGYVERQTRRDADKLLRDTVARRFEEQWKRASQLQSDMVSNGMIAYVDDMEKASIQIIRIVVVPSPLFSSRNRAHQFCRAFGWHPIDLKTKTDFKR